MATRLTSKERAHEIPRRPASGVQRGLTKSAMKEQRAPAAKPKERAVRKKALRESRSEKVERARRLIEDKSYPSKKVLQSVADLLSKRLKP
jgi:hypothetical protein